MSSELDTTWHEPLKRPTLSEEIADRLIASIVSGRFLFGERLPPERDLARLFDVGRPTVREAMRILNAIGLIEVRPGSGTFLVNSHGDFLAKAFSWTVLLDPQTAREVVETRVAIESELAALAAERATEDEISLLRDLLHQMEKNTANAKRFWDADLSFHLVIAEAARNVTLHRIATAINSLLHQWMMRAPVKMSFDVALRHHERILGGLEARDREATRQAMQAHLEEMGVDLIKKLQERQGDDQENLASFARRVDSAMWGLV